MNCVFDRYQPTQPLNFFCSFPSVPNHFQDPYPYSATLAASGPNISQMEESESEYQALYNDRREAEEFESHVRDVTMVLNSQYRMSYKSLKFKPRTILGYTEFGVKFEAVNVDNDIIYQESSILGEHHNDRPYKFRLTIKSQIAQEWIFVYFDRKKSKFGPIELYETFSIDRTIYVGQDLTQRGNQLRDMADILLLYLCSKLGAKYLTFIRGKHKTLPSEFFYSSQHFESKSERIDDIRTKFSIKCINSLGCQALLVDKFKELFFQMIDNSEKMSGRILEKK